MRYVEARIEETHRVDAYRIYVTDSLRLALKLNVRYADLFARRTDSKTEEKTNEEVIAHFKAGLGALGGKTNGLDGFEGDNSGGHNPVHRSNEADEKEC